MNNNRLNILGVGVDTYSMEGAANVLVSTMDQN